MFLFQIIYFKNLQTSQICALCIVGKKGKFLNALQYLSCSFAFHLIVIVLVLGITHFKKL